ncbi:MAG TPA: flagellar motor protein MotB [Thermotogota bacterium]|jgi:chemotaxis protein MotB|nr:MAG: Motility protein B [Thermotogota bacterium ADurb.Bin062]HNW47142.1 flagellar motor protein MotB [Thermotogota bacterium]HNY82171.1 flagellar motor protein MotB [Thermotogota bacterium]HOD91832.1 flagellar motor protein MotB [Thermotogota bacterium]HOF24305.1 flagellar motor protein MotB [Thermotogota bacterium]
MAKKCPECKAGAPFWLTTYGDMITLMLCFFVALLAFSSINPGKFQEVASGISMVFAGSPPSVLMGGRTTVSDPVISSNPGVKEEIVRISQDDSFKGKLSIIENEEGTLIVLSKMAFFEPFSAKLTADAKTVLEKIGAVVVEHTTNVLEIRGYTDDRTPPENSIYPSNWHLGAARAASITKYFLEDLKTKRIAERVVDIRNGRFDPDFYYDPRRFAPVSKGDIDILSEVRSMDMEAKNQLELLDYQLKDGEITQEQAKAKLETMKAEYQSAITVLRHEFQRVDILIKREKVR